MDIITEDCPHCGVPNANHVDEPGEYIWECMECKKTFGIRYHTPKNAIVLTEEEAVYYDHDGKSQKLEDKDKEDMKKVFDKVKNTKSVDATPMGRVR